MSTVPPPKKDTWLLLSVAALVVVGVVGIALIAGLTVDDEPAPPAATAVAEPAPPVRRTPPIAVAEDAGDPWKTPGSTIGPEVEPQATPADGPAIDPDAEPFAEGQRAYARREFALAAAYFEADAGARPQSAYTLYMLGLSLWKDGRLDAAADALARAAERNEVSIRTWVNLSRVENERGRFDEALGAAERALAVDDDDASALYLKARSLRNLGRTEEARSILEACLAVDPGHGDAHNLAGLIRLHRGEGSAAIESFTRAARLLPDVVYVHNNLGQALEAEHRWSEAVLAYRRALELDGGHPAAAVALARVEPRVGPTGVAEIEVAGIDPAEPAIDEAEALTASASAPAPVSDDGTGGTP